MQEPPRPKTQEEIRQEIRSTMTSDQLLALDLNNALTDLYNEKVVAQMNKIKAMFPTSLRDDLVKIEALSDCQEFSQEQHKIREQIKAVIDDT